MTYKSALSLFAASLSLLTLTACISDDFGGYSDSYYGQPQYYGQPPSPPPQYYGQPQYYGRPQPPPPQYYGDGRHHDGHHDRHGRAQGSPRSGEFSAGGSAKEFAFGPGCRRCTITVLDGSVGFRTIAVRSGSARNPVTINATFQRGQSFDVPIDSSSTGLRISDTGRGRYRVNVK